MPLYCPDRELYPPDPIEEREETRCSHCDDAIYSDQAVKDFIGQPICERKRCIEECWAIDLEGHEPSKHREINEYYDKLLNGQP